MIMDLITMAQDGAAHAAPAAAGITGSVTAGFGQAAGVRSIEDGSYARAKLTDGQAHLFECNTPLRTLYFCRCDSNSHDRRGR